MSSKAATQDDLLTFDRFTVELANQESMRPIDKQMLLDAEAGKHEDMAFLLSRGANVNAAGVTGWTPLMYAASYNYPTAAKLLLSHQADLHLKNRNGQTAYEISLERKNPEMTEMLLQAMVDTNTIAQGPIKAGKPLRLKF
ncbi:MAG: ankyrin repeat domain-containing protein [Alphaproteobacteria bacterium]